MKCYGTNIYSCIVESLKVMFRAGTDCFNCEHFSEIIFSDNIYNKIQSEINDVTFVSIHSF